MPQIVVNVASTTPSFYLIHAQMLDAVRVPLREGRYAEARTYLNNAVEFRKAFGFENRDEYTESDVLELINVSEDWALYKVTVQQSESGSPIEALGGVAGQGPDLVATADWRTAARQMSLGDFVKWSRDQEQLRPVTPIEDVLQLVSDNSLRDDIDSMIAIEEKAAGYNLEAYGAVAITTGIGAVIGNTRGITRVDMVDGLPIPAKRQPASLDGPAPWVGDRALEIASCDD